MRRLEEEWRWEQVIASAFPEQSTMRLYVLGCMMMWRHLHLPELRVAVRSIHSPMARFHLGKACIRCKTCLSVYADAPLPIHWNIVGIVSRRCFRGWTKVWRHGKRVFGGAGDNILGEDHSYAKKARPAMMLHVKTHICLS